MESPFNEKDERSDNNVFNTPISVQSQSNQAPNPENRELENSGISVPLVENSHNMIVVNQDSRVVFPSLVNNHDQNTNQEGLGNEMAEEMNIYSSLDNNVILYPGQRIDRHAGIPVAEELKTDMDLMDGGKKKLDNTLVGKIIEILRQERRPLTRDEIQQKIGSDFNELRKSDGTKYKGDRTKALNGALYSTGIFHKDNDVWTIREEEIESYERKTRIKLESKGKRKRAASAQQDGEDQPYQKRKYVRKQVKKSTVVKLLKETSESLRMKDPETHDIYFKNPFQGLTGGEQIIKIRKKLGDEKFEMAIQMFNYFEDALMRVMNEDTALTHMTDSQVGQYIDHLQMEVNTLKTQLAALENKVNVTL